LLLVLSANPHFFSNVPWKSFLRENPHFLKEETSFCDQDQRKQLFPQTEGAIPMCVTMLQHNKTSHAISSGA